MAGWGWVGGSLENWRVILISAFNYVIVEVVAEIGNNIGLRICNIYKISVNFWFFQNKPPFLVSLNHIWGNVVEACLPLLLLQVSLLKSCTPLFCLCMCLTMTGMGGHFPSPSNILNGEWSEL